MSSFTSSSSSSSSSSPIDSLTSSINSLSFENLTKEELIEEIKRLKEENNLLSNKILKLEDECDILAQDNEKMREFVINSSNSSVSSLPSVVSGSNSASVTTSTSSIPSSHPTFYISNNDSIKQSCVSTIPLASSGLNVISSKIFGNLNRENIGEITVLNAGVDKFLHINLLTPLNDDEDKENEEMKQDINKEKYITKRIHSFPVSAPILIIEQVLQYAVCGLMDGSLSIYKITKDEYKEVATFKNHSRFIVDVKASPCGTLLATIAHDKKVQIYYLDKENETYIEYKHIQFSNTPESLCFYSSEDSKLQLIVGLRDTIDLTYLDVSFNSFPPVLSLAPTYVTLNDNQWDTHVSFTPLALKISPDNKKLLVATEKNMIIIYKPGTNEKILTINNGNICGEYSNPVQGVCWSNCSQYIYCVNDGEDGKVKDYNENNKSSGMNSNYSIKVLTLIDGKEIKSLIGHTGKIRSISISNVNGNMMLSSASYDKSVKIWK